MPSSATGQPVGRSEDLLRRAVLATTLVLSCLTGFATSYLLLVLAVIAAGYLLVRRAGFVFDGAGRLFVAAFVGLAILFALSAERPADVLFAINFIAFLAYVPLATLLGRAAAPGNAETVAKLALAGAAVGCAVSLVEVYGLGAARAGLYITDTIRLGNTAVLLGFLSLIGLTQPGDRRRWLFLLGPVLAAIVALLTGARGAMLAIPVLALGAVFLIVGNKWIALITGSATVLGFVAAAGVFGSSRLESVFQIFHNIATGAPVADHAMAVRFKLYEAGWQAFEQSPLFGHGWARLMSSVEPFLAGADKTYAKLPHLHNEVLNFAVFGGVAGVAIYLVLIAMPIIIALRSRRDGQYRARLAGTGILALGYVVMGLPDTMLSFDLHTALYVALVATLLGYCRDEREPEAA